MTSVDGGLTLLDKPAGVTSFAALGTLKRNLGTGKVGHGGTLDKFATGLLVVMVGRATKLLRLVVGLEKSYEAVFRFGTETDTLDPEGTVVATADPPPENAIDDAVGRFVGEISQEPPAYSAVHVGGERAYRLARRGAEVKVPQRQVCIHRIDVRSYDGRDLAVAVDCSSGTYIRSLARDLGRAVRSCAHVVELRRTSVGPFRVEEATKVAEFHRDTDVLPFESFVSRLPGVTTATVSEAARASLARGQRVSRSMLAGEGDGSFVAAFDRDGRFLALLEQPSLKFVFNRGGGW